MWPTKYISSLAATDGYGSGETNADERERASKRIVFCHLCDEARGSIKPLNSTKPYLFKTSNENFDYFFKHVFVFIKFTLRIVINTL